MAEGTVSIKTEVLEDLATRFLINVPEEEKSDMMKLCSHMELAHWFYLDHLQPSDPALPKCNVKEFITTLCHHYPFLAKGASNDLDNIISKWKAHRQKQPLRGGIILNEPLTKCLLVQGYSFTCLSWGLPKGKLEQNEKDVDCAVREIYEETGLDARELIKKDEYLEAKLNGRRAKMFVVWGVSEEKLLAPRSMKEIKAIQWFPIETLPSTFKEVGRKQETFNGVIPFVKPLRDWISRHQDAAVVTKNNTKNNATGSTEQSNTTTSPQHPVRSGSVPHKVNGLVLEGIDSANLCSTSVSNAHASEVIKQMLTLPQNGLGHLETRRNTQPSLKQSPLTRRSPRRASSSQTHPSNQASPSSLKLRARNSSTKHVSTPAVPSPQLKSTSSNIATEPPATRAEESFVEYKLLLRSTPPDVVTVQSSASGMASSNQGHKSLLLTDTLKQDIPGASNPSLFSGSSDILVSIPLQPSKSLIHFTFDRRRILTVKVGW